MENHLIFERDNIDTSIFNYMLSYSKRRNNLATLRYFGRDICFDEVISKIEKTAQYLLDLGIKNGDSITVCLPNIPAAVYAVYGINRAGGVTNIVHPAITPKRLAEAVRETYSEILMVSEEYYAANKSFLDALKLKKIILCPIAEDMPKITAALYLIKNLRNPFRADNGADNKNTIRFSHATSVISSHPFPAISGSDAAVYMHSGGTTGVPKTVTLSNKNLNSLVRNLLTSIEEGDDGYAYSEKDTMYGALPFFHGYGLGVCMHTSLCARMRLSLVPRFTAKGFIGALERDRITVTAGLPNMYAKIINDKGFVGEKLKTLKNAYVGSEKMPDLIKTDFDKRVAEFGGSCVLEEGYGLSETVNVCLLNRKAKNRDGSVGAPIANTLAEIFDADNNPVDAGERGELCISSEAVMQGYLKDSDTTKDVIFTDKTGISWLKTGDMAHRDDDGFVYYDGRKKRLIIISGINVFPSEIEGVATSLDYIAEACAVSAELSGKRIIVLNVVMTNGIALTDKLKKDLCISIKNNLSKWHVPTIIIARDKLPMTEMNKVDYVALENKTE